MTRIHSCDYVRSVRDDGVIPWATIKPFKYSYPKIVLGILTYKTMNVYGTY
jgi:hypothetical protein